MPLPSSRIVSQGPSAVRHLLLIPPRAQLRRRLPMAAALRLPISPNLRHPQQKLRPSQLVLHLPQPDQLQAQLQLQLQRSQTPTRAQQQRPSAARLKPRPRMKRRPRPQLALICPTIPRPLAPSAAPGQSSGPFTLPLSPTRRARSRFLLRPRVITRSTGSCRARRADTQVSPTSCPYLQPGTS